MKEVELRQKQSPTTSPGYLGSFWKQLEKVYFGLSEPPISGSAFGFGFRISISKRGSSRFEATKKREVAQKLVEAERDPGDPTEEPKRASQAT